MATVIKYLLLFSVFFISSLFLHAQSGEQVLLQNGLIEISKQHKLSLIFNPKNLSNHYVDLPSQNWPVEKQLETILRGTDMTYKISEKQIFLYRNHNIYGYIEDEESGERLISATIYSPKNGAYDIANEAGYFTLSTIEDSLNIEISYLGYATNKKTIHLHDMDRPIVLGLTLDNSIREVVISDALVTNEERKYIELNKGSDILLYQKQSSSAVGGEPDIFQAIVRQTGVNSGPDGIGGLHIRGGKNDQNQVLYDGVRLYNSAHAFGVYSIINSNIIDQARLHKSGARGALSGRLSSIMDIKIKEPSLNTVKANAQISTLASQANIETPIIKDKLGVMINGRRTHIDPIIKSISRDRKNENFDTGETNFYFDDLSLKLYGKINNNQRIYLSYYKASDHYVDDLSYQLFDPDLLIESKESSSIKWKNELAAVRYNVILNPTTFANIQLSKYSYDFKNNYLSTFFDLLDYTPYYDRLFVDYESGISTSDIRLDFQTQINNHTLKYGLVGSQKKYQGGILKTEALPDIIDTSEPLSESIEIQEDVLGEYDAVEMELYLSDKFKWKNNLLLEAGAYLNYYKSVDVTFGSSDGRFTNLYGYLTALYLFTDELSVGGSIGTYLQNEHLLTVGDNGYPSDIWLPSTDLTPPEKSYQAEVFTEFSKNGHRLKTGAYYKEQKGLVVLNFLPVLPSITNLETDYWEEETFLSDANSVGLEVDYSYSIVDRFSFRAVYTGGYTDYVFDDGLGGRGSYPFEYSIPHTINLALNTTILDRLQLSVDWVYAAGRPHTIYAVDKKYSPIERPESGAIITQISENYNDSKLPSTHKLSAAFSTYWHWGRIKSNLTLGVQNIYNQQNPLYTYQFDDYYDMRLEEQAAFPMMPIFRWRLEFE